MDDAPGVTRIPKSTCSLTRSRRRGSAIAIERGGGLVHHEDARVDGERLGHLDHPPLGDRQVARAGFGTDRRTEPGEQTLCVVPHLGPIQHAVACRLYAGEDIFRDAPVRQEADPMDDADAGAARGDGVRKLTS